METIKVFVGSTKTLSGGQFVDNTRPVEFVGEELGAFHTLTGDNDTRGVKETLFRAEDGRLIVHVREWTKWQGEPDIHSLHEVTEKDLQPNGRFEFLGAACGFGRPLTLDEALSEKE